MEVEKRKGELPIPENLSDYLNQAQITALDELRLFGWELKFIRHPLFQDPVAVVTNSTEDMIGILAEDGQLDMRDDIKLRK